MTSLASNWSQRLRTRRSQRSAPEMISCKVPGIWKPLETPGVKASVRSTKPWN
jgi:hypothetical protein